MTRKSLWNWYQSDDITSTERNKILEIGYIDDSPQLYLSSWRKLYYYQLVMDRLRSQINIFGSIQTLILFSTHWNPNCIIVINGDGNYGVNLLVYEMSSGQMNETLEKIWIEGGYSYLSSAKSKAYEVERKLKGDNPITFYYTPNSRIEIKAEDSWEFLSPVFPFTKKNELPFQSAKSNPDNYVKPLDIVRVCESVGGYGVHTCIYLGNRKVAHNLPSGGVRIDDWENFTNFGAYGERSYGVMTRYHPIVAYKHSDKIIEHIAKVMGGEFDIRKNNCESFANKCVHNLDISEHMSGMNGKCVTTVEREVVGNTVKTSITTSCGGGVCMSLPLGRLTSTEEFDRFSRNYYKESEIKNYVQSSSHFEGIKLEERIEIAPKSSYRMN